MKKNIQIISCIAFIAIIASLSFVSADYWKCFYGGEKIKFCNKNANYNRCHNYNFCTIDSDRVEICIGEYNQSGGCYSQGNGLNCNSNPKQCSANGNSTIDSEAPVLTINSPAQNGIFNSRSILFDLSMDETGSIYYYDNINGKGKFTRLCADCYSYYNHQSFHEGLNDLTFKAVDVIGNDAYVNLSFFIDSKKPQIHKTLPTSSFANGEFDVQYSEDNVKSIKLIYGNTLSGFKAEEAKDCTSGKKKWCAFDVSLPDYEGEDIEYHFVVEDIAGNLKESKKINLEVDQTFPVLNNEGSFWHQEGKYIFFLFNVTEKNFGKIYYSYKDARGMEKEKTLCSSLKNGICSKKESFMKGDYSIAVNILDKAGNMITEPVSFKVD